MYVRKTFNFRGTAPTFARPQFFRFLSLEILKTLVYLAPIEYEDTLHQRNFYGCKPILNRPETFENVRQSMIMCVHACIDSGGEKFEYFIWMVTGSTTKIAH
jgi:hypothetical protein